MALKRTEKFERRAHGRVSGLRDLAVCFPAGSSEAIISYWDGESAEQLAVGRVAPTKEAFDAAFATCGGLSPNAVFRVVDSAFGARTRLFQYGESLREADDDFVNSLLIETANLAGAETSSSSFFDTNLDEMACDWSRLPDGEVAVTDLPKDHFLYATGLLDSWLEGGRNQQEEVSWPSSMNLVMETPLRAVLRLYLSAQGFSRPAQVEGETSSTGDGPTLAILIVSSAGFAHGLWSPQHGLHKELGEAFMSDAPEEEVSVSSSSLSDEVLQELREASIGHAVSRFAGLVRSGLAKPERLAFAASADTLPAVREALSRFADAAGLPLDEIPVALEEAVAQGLMLGTDESAVPVINLAGDLRRRASLAQEEEERARRALRTRRRANLALAMAAPLVIALTFVLSSWLYARAVSVKLAHDNRVELAEQARLKPIQAERKSAVENIKWFQTVVNQILDRRSKQSNTVRLFEDLNARWPSDDATWYVKEMTVSSTGALEIKGLTKREESVTAFNRSLEFSGGLFTNAYPQVVSAVPAASGTTGVATAQLSNNPVAPGITSWVVKASYTPLASQPPGPPAPVQQAPAVPTTPTVIAPPANQTTPGGPIK